MTFNPLRLSIARKRRMFRIGALADKLGVTRQTVSRWEKGEAEPEADNLDSLQRILDFPVSFFFGEDLDEADLTVTSFRSQTAMSAATRDAALAAGSIGFLLSDWVGTLFNLPLTQIPSLEGIDPENAARALREEWGLGEQPIPNMVHLLEANGVRVFSLTENTAHVNAYSLWRRNQAYVFLNTFKSAECSRFDAAHELAHLALHQDGSVTGREAEDQAQKFASSFLMPRSDVIASMPRAYHIGQLVQAKRRWKVSVAALNYRLHKLGLISDWKNRDFNIEISRRGYHKNEPESIPREKSILWEKVLRSLWSEGVSIDAIADTLHVRTCEIEDLVFGILVSDQHSHREQKPSPLACLSESEGNAYDY